MRVLYHHRTRGTDAQRVHILEIVNAFRELGHEVRIASLIATEEQNAAREASEAGWKKIARKIPMTYEAIQLAYNAVGLPWLLWESVSFRPDFIYERYSLFCFAGVLAAKLTGKPIVLEVNSPFALEQTRDGEIRLPRFAAWLERLICNSASKVIVVSGPLRRILLDAGVRPEKLMLVPNGINPEHLAACGSRDELRAQCGLNERIVIGFVGWFKPWHGLEFLIEAFLDSGLAARGAALLLVGDGPAMAPMREMVARRNATADVVFSGPIEHERIPAYLHLMDIAVQPAANEYCCPMKIIEYMGVGKPVIAPRQENIQELLPEDAAMLFEPGNAADLVRAMAAVVESAELRQSLGRRAEQVVWSRGLLWSANAAKTIETLRQAGSLQAAPPSLPEPRVGQS
ncbi:MAG: glycosyltransferase family 4 protein [Acidobacteriaceae bacterium]|nr:glycosyltransferase family 4 protein [Acidobacteriaceae bacterium]